MRGVPKKRTVRFVASNFNDCPLDGIRGRSFRNDNLVTALHRDDSPFSAIKYLCDQISYQAADAAALFLAIQPALFVYLVKTRFTLKFALARYDISYSTV